MANHNLKTLSQVLTILVQRGITKEISMNERHQMILGKDEKIYEPEDLCIVKSYRFEGDSNPDDNAVLYLLEDTDGELSTILDSYGAESNYSGEEFDDFLRKIPIQENPEYDFD
jgi:division protein CdvB (Snf7/Vps24/ESCRT-III family)